MHATRHAVLTPDTNAGLFYAFSPGPSTQPSVHTADDCEEGTSSLLPAHAVLTHQTESESDTEMLQYHRDIPITVAEVVEEYVRCHPRRLLMVNPLAD